MGLALSGRRSMAGAMHGPVNDPNVNGSHPALLAAPAGGATNSDVQLPYRLPICEATHAEGSLCDEDCVATANLETIVEDAQKAQDAQAGYAATTATSAGRVPSTRSRSVRRTTGSLPRTPRTRGPSTWASGT